MSNPVRTAVVPDGVGVFEGGLGLAGEDWAEPARVAVIVCKQEK